MTKFNAFKRALGKLDQHKKTPQEKANETKQHSIRMCEMQDYVDKSLEKRNLLFETINKKSNDSELTILQKGVIVYVKLLEVVDIISNDLTSKGIDNRVITSKQSQKKRTEISEWFMKDPSNKVVIISSAGAESLNLNATNEIILYDIPDGSGKFNQTIGRICRMFGLYDEFNIHFIIVEETLDEYKPIALSSKKELEEELLSADVIPLKSEARSFDAQVLKKIKNNMLWKLGKKKRKPK